jgi:hypothetical protein
MPVSGGDIAGLTQYGAEVKYRAEPMPVKHVRHRFETQDIAALGVDLSKPVMQRGRFTDDVTRDERPCALARQLARIACAQQPGSARNEISCRRTDWMPPSKAQPC